MTTAQILWRLTWKEYRAQRALWWAVLVLTLIVEGLAGLTLELLEKLPLTASGHLVVVFGAVAIYLLGCGATLFALEHEQGTFEFQRLLPSTSGSVFAAKAGVGYLGGLALGLVLLVPTLFFSVDVFRETTPEDWIAGWVTFTEIFLWSVLFSLLLRDPLRAAVCGIFGASIVACAVLPIFNEPSWTEDVFLFHRGSLGARSLMVVGLLLVDFSLAVRWFRGGTLAIRFPALRAMLSNDLDLVLRPLGGPIPKYFGGHQAGFGRLVGIAWRQGKWIWSTCAALFAATFCVELWNPGSVAFLVLVWILSLLLYSWCSFGLDQRGNQFRFYAERGIDPRWLWLSRQVTWFSPLLLMAILLQWAWMSSSRPGQSEVDTFMNHMGVVLFTLMAYSAGQLWAMAIRRALLTLVVIVFSNLILFFWLALTVQGEVPWWLSLLPIPVVCWYATWRFGANWIEERRGKRHRRELLAVFGLPAAIVLPAIAAHRAYSIPAIPPPVVLADYTRPMTASERETLFLYTQAHQELKSAALAAGGKLPVSTSSEAQSLAGPQHARVMEFLRKAHLRPRVPISMTPETVGGEPKGKLGDFDASELVDLVSREARHLTSQGKLAEAWRAYEVAFELLERIRLRGGPASLLRADGWENWLLHGVVDWSNHRDQTAAMVAVAQLRLADWDQAGSSGQDTTTRLVKIDYVQWSLFLEGDSFAAAELGLRPQETSIVRGLAWLFPWEAMRCRRLSDQLTAFSLSEAQYETQLIQLHRHCSSTLPLSSNRYPRMPVAQFPTVFEVKINRRAARLLLALTAWRRDHGGKLPERLQELRDASPALELTDPATRRPFIYSVHGTSHDVRDLNQESVVLPKNIAFLWSPGSTRTVIEEPSPGVFTVVADARGAYAPDLSFDKVVTQGVLWKIPPYQGPSPHP